MAPHIKVLSISCFYHIRSFRQIRSSLDDSTSVSVPPALIPSRLDQLNSTLYCISLKHTARLSEFSVQWLELSCTSNIVHLHCLQMNFANNSIGSQSNGVYELNLPPWPSKPCTLVVRNIPDLLQHHEPTRSLRSSSSHQLSVPHHNLSFGSCAFWFSAPRVSNSLPVSIREC